MFGEAFEQKIRLCIPSTAEVNRVQVIYRSACNLNTLSVTPCLSHPLTLRQPTWRTGKPWQWVNTNWLVGWVQASLRTDNSYVERKRTARDTFLAVTFNRLCQWLSKRGVQTQDGGRVGRLRKCRVQSWWTWGESDTKTLNMNKSAAFDT